MFDDVYMVHGGWCGRHGAVSPNFELPEHVRDRHILRSLYLFTTCPTLVYGSQPKVWTGQVTTDKSCVLKM